MKKLKVLLCSVMVAGMFMTSCSDDDSDNNNNDDNNPITNASLEGKWNYNQEGFGGMGIESLQDHSHMAGCSKDYVRFSSGGAYQDVEYVEDCAMEIHGDTWVRNGNTIIIGTGESATTEEIVTLNDNVLKVREVYQGTGNQTTYLITTYTRAAQ